MTDEELTALAIEAKVEAFMEDLRWFYDQIVADERNKYLDRLAKAIDVSVKAEREACANMCEEIEEGYQENESGKWPELRTDAQHGAGECAAAIRARGQHE